MSSNTRWRAGAAPVRLNLTLCCSFVVATVAGGGGFCPGDAEQHTGYLDAGPGASYFYYLARSRSDRPASDPLILWLTGGPGCSSILALLVENGPCLVAKQDGAEWKMSRNSWSWSEVANVVWVDQPVGVGFSTSYGPRLTNESQVADRMLVFLQHFYLRFPELLRVPLYITGESYGGHYVPAVARLVQLKPEGLGRLAGIAIGNGWVDPAVQYLSMPEMAWSGGSGGSLTGGTISWSTYLQMVGDVAKCELDIQECLGHPLDQRCGSGQSTCAAAFIDCVKKEVLPVTTMYGKNQYDLRKQCGTPGLCYDFDKEIRFLNDPAVKKSLGVPAERAWVPCNTTSLVPFICSGDELVDYRENVAELLRGGARVLVYAGDTDFICNWIGCEAWVARLPWPHHQSWVSTSTKPFIVDGEECGKIRTHSGLTFLQIYNAGHMVPMDVPKVALEMIRRFIAGPEAGLELAAPAKDAWRSVSPLATLLVPAAAAALGALAVLCIPWSLRWSRFFAPNLSWLWSPRDPQDAYLRIT